MFSVRSSPCPAPPICSRAPCPARCLHRGRPPPLPPADPYTSPRRTCPSFRLLAGAVGVQPAAELRHLQRHIHERHVLRALLPVPCPQSAVEPRALHAACTAVAC